MKKSQNQDNENEPSKVTKQLRENLVERFDLDVDFVEALKEGMNEYEEALKNLQTR